MFRLNYSKSIIIKSVPLWFLKSKAFNLGCSSYDYVSLPILKLSQQMPNQCPSQHINSSVYCNHVWIWYLISLLVIQWFKPNSKSVIGECTCLILKLSSVCSIFVIIKTYRSLWIICTKYYIITKNNKLIKLI